MSSRRWLALCGIAAPLLVVLAIVAVAPNTPEPDARTDEIMTYYRSHLDRNRFAALMVGLAGVLVVLFAARLREHLEAGEGGASAFSRAAFAGGVLGGAGLITTAVVHFALADAADDGLTSAAEALNALDGVTVIGAAMGLALLYFAAGVAVLCRGTLPRWLGWSAVVIGVVTFAGPIGFFAALLGLVWLVVIGVLLVRRPDDVPAVAAPALA